VIDRYLRAFRTPVIARSTEDEFVLAMGGTLLLVAAIAAVLLVDLGVKVWRRRRRQ
jgi:hypothetical protein